MNRLTPLVLLVVVAGLGWLVHRQTRQESQLAETEAAVPLFGEVDPGRLVAVRLEDIARSRHIRLERDPAGRWFLADPLAWPAKEGVVAKFLQVIQGNRGLPVPPSVAADAAGSFAPPMGFLETVEELPGGERRTVRVEVGAVDLDGTRIFVRKDGRILRTVRNIENLFAFGVSDYRSRRLFGLPRGNVARLERQGVWVQDGVSRDLTLVAEGLGEHWALEEPVECPGDPVVFAAWTSYLSTMRAARFASDLPDPDLSRYGLASPSLVLRITGLQGVTETLYVGQAEGQVFAQREGRPTIFELDDESIPFLCEGIEQFIELRFTRIPRGSLATVRIDRAGGAVRLTQGAEGWTVARADGGGRWSPEYPADPLVLKDLFTAMEDAEVQRTFLDAEPSRFFVEGGPEVHVLLTGFGGERAGGRFAPVATLPDGTAVAPYLRLGSSVPQGFAPAFVDRLDLPFEDLLTRSLWTQTNTWLRELALEGDGRTVRFERGDGFDWRRAGTEQPARVLDPVLESLLFLKAEGHLPPAGPEDGPIGLTDPVTVTFTDAEHQRSVARIGVGATGRVLAEVGALRAVLKRPALHGELLEILRSAE